MISKVVIIFTRKFDIAVADQLGRSIVNQALPACLALDLSIHITVQILDMIFPIL